MRIVLVCGGVPLQSGRALGEDTRARLAVAHRIGAQYPDSLFLVGSAHCPALPDAEKTQGEMMLRCLLRKLKASKFPMDTFDTYGEVKGFTVGLANNPDADIIIVSAAGHKARLLYLLKQLAPDHKKPVTFVAAEDEVWSRIEHMKEKLRYAKARLPRRTQVMLVKMYRTVFGYF